MESNLQNAMEKAEDFLITAKDNLMYDHLLGAVNRCYYAYFWIVRGLLFEKDVFVKSHSGVKLKFSELFIKTQIIPDKYGYYLSKLMTKRQNADYDLGSDFTKEDVEEMITWTDDFLEYIKQNIERL
jgi:uncharacterized protein (UPF0332 family)